MPMAMGWAAGISDPVFQEKTLFRLYNAWKRVDAGAADSYLQNTGWPLGRIARIQSGGQNSRHP